jgi:hypothetical protein
MTSDSRRAHWPASGNAPWDAFAESGARMRPPEVEPATSVEETHGQLVTIGRCTRGLRALQVLIQKKQGRPEGPLRRVSEKPPNSCGLRLVVWPRPELPVRQLAILEAPLIVTAW